MDSQQQLKKFIDDSRKIGKSDQEIRNTLINAGWSPEQLKSVLPAPQERTPSATPSNLPSSENKPIAAMQSVYNKPRDDNGVSPQNDQDEVKINVDQLASPHIQAPTSSALPAILGVVLIVLGVITLIIYQAGSRIFNTPEFTSEAVLLNNQQTEVTKIYEFSAANNPYQVSLEFNHQDVPADPIKYRFTFRDPQGKILKNEEHTYAPGQQNALLRKIPLIGISPHQSLGLLEIPQDGKYAIDWSFTQTSITPGVQMNYTITAAVFTLPVGVLYLGFGLIIIGIILLIIKVIRN